MSGTRREVVLAFTTAEVRESAEAVIRQRLRAILRDACEAAEVAELCSARPKRGPFIEANLRLGKR